MQNAPLCSRLTSPCANFQTLWGGHVSSPFFASDGQRFEGLLAPICEVLGSRNVPTRTRAKCLVVAVQFHGGTVQLHTSGDHLNTHPDSCADCCMIEFASSASKSIKVERSPIILSLSHYSSICGTSEQSCPPLIL